VLPSAAPRVAPFALVYFVFLLLLLLRKLCRCLCLCVHGLDCVSLCLAIDDSNSCVCGLAVTALRLGVDVAVCGAAVTRTGCRTLVLRCATLASLLVVN